MKYRLNKAELTSNIVVAPPAITEQPNSQTIYALEDVTFSCKARGFKVKYEWRRNNDSHTIGRQSSLTILSATPMDRNGYYCVVYCSKQHYYVSSNTATLKVIGEWLNSYTYSTCLNQILQII